MERTFAMIKPDAVANKHIGEIITAIEQASFNIVAMKKMQFSTALAEKFYAVHTGKPFFNDLVSYIASGPVIALILEKSDAIKAWRDLMGATDPLKASPGTIRKRFGKHIGANATHGSDAPETAATECKLIFPEA